MKYLLFLFSLVSITAFGQTDSSRMGPVFSIVQQMPKFKGDLNKYLADNIQYPAAEREANITGTVFVGFIVNKDGSVSDAKVMRGVVGGPGLDAEALRVVSAMPAWTSGVNGGKVVRVQYNMPIHFQLR